MTRKPGDAPEREGDEPLLSRWSRLKREARQPQPPAEKPVDPKAPAPELPPLDKLTIDSDYRDFFHPKVGEDVRRAALKKLFGNPHFNVMDGLDVYIDDYSKTEPIPPAMLAGLKQAQDILRSAKEDEAQRAQDERARRSAPPALESPASQPVPPAGTASNAPEAAPAEPGTAGEAGSPARGTT